MNFSDPALFSKSVIDVGGLGDIRRLTLRGRHSAGGFPSVEAPLGQYMSDQTGLSSLSQIVPYLSHWIISLAL